MAMTKKEQTEFEKARSYRSLRFSDYPTSTDLDAKSSDARQSMRRGQSATHTAPVTVRMKIDVVPLRVRFRYIQQRYGHLVRCAGSWKTNLQPCFWK